MALGAAASRPTSSGRLSAAGEPLGFSTAGNPAGAVFGGQVGYNWQWASLVFGVEGDFDAATLTASGNAVTNSIAVARLPSRVSGILKH